MDESGGVSENFLKYFMKFVEGARKLKSVLVDRDEEIDTIACAFLTGTNVLLIGEPGTGKSLVVNEFAKLVGMGPENGYFHYLLTKYTEPSEILGPIDIKSLREGKYEVITKNKLPEASLVFLDEVFNANSAILNSLLTLINEKKLILGNMYKNMDDLICVYGASNHVPQDPLLLAFFDRFPIRLLVKHVEPSVENYKKLLQKEINIEVSDKVEPILKRKESISFAKEFNRLVTTKIEEMIDNDFLKSVFNSVKYLKSGAEIFISDRNLKHIVKMIVAYSMLRSEKTSVVPNKSDIIFVLTKVWNNEEQKDEIERFLVR